MYTDKGVHNNSGTPFFVSRIHGSQTKIVYGRSSIVRHIKEGEIQA